MLEALATLPVTVVAETLGSRSGTPPKNAWLAEYLPRREVLRRTQLMIAGGSTSSTQQALSAGVPVVGIVTSMGQHLTMPALVHAGAGRFLRAGELDESALRDAVLAIIARPSFTEAAKSLSRTLAKYDAATRFQELLARIPRRTAASL